MQSLLHWFLRRPWFAFVRLTPVLVAPGTMTGMGRRDIVNGAAFGREGQNDLRQEFEARPGWRDMMVFRKESRADSFQRQISALRQQLGTDQEEDDYPRVDDSLPSASRSATETPVSAPSTDFSTSEGSAGIGVIASNSHWNGVLRSEGSLRILGHVEGELHAADEILVAEGANVEARVFADRVTIAGRVTGTVECMSRLEVLPSGHVVGDVTSPTLIVHEGATVEGDLSMRAPAARPA